jgi:hypothetical protein
LDLRERDPLRPAYGCSCDLQRRASINSIDGAS